MTTISVLLVDDHLVVRSGLKALLGTQPDISVVAEAASGEDALLAMAEHSPAVIIMDLAMGAGIDGIEAIKALRRINSRQAVIVFTTYDSDADIVRAVDAGAMGYLLKDATPEEIFAAVRGAVQGKSVMSAPVASRLFQQLRNPDEVLTPREAELLSLLTEGLSNRRWASGCSFPRPLSKRIWRTSTPSWALRAGPAPSPRPSAARACANCSAPAPAARHHSVPAARRFLQLLARMRAPSHVRNSLAISAA